MERYHIGGRHQQSEHDQSVQYEDMLRNRGHITLLEELIEQTISE
jgi:hypothetical protein